MNVRVLLAALCMVVSACQTSLPFYSKNVEEPEWFKAKAAEADAKGFPAARAVPPRPQGLPSPEARAADLKAVADAGTKVRNDPRATLDEQSATKTEAFTSEAREKNIAPPLVDDDTSSQ